MINEKGQIKKKNKYETTTYSNLNELCELIFPYANGKNTYYSEFGYFKPKVPKKIDVKKLFD